MKIFFNLIAPKYLMNINLQNGDCLELMKNIPDGSVDCVLTDVPYYSTDLAFDKAPRIDFDKWFEQCFRALKSFGVLVTFCDFRLGRIISQHKFFRYEIIWQKTNPVGFLDASFKPLKNYEYILVFINGSIKKSTYNPQKTKGKPYTANQPEKKIDHYDITRGGYTTINNGDRYPTTIQKWSNNNHNSPHPTAKPLEGLHWLVNTYSNQGDVILDPFMGSGTTGIACANLDRNFIGFELDRDYFQIAKARIEQAQTQKDLILI